VSLLSFNSKQLNKEVAMFRKIAVITFLLALVLASFPTNTVLAKDVKADNMEKKWDQLVSNYNMQSYKHEQTHKLVASYIKTNKNIKAADKAELEKHLAICNSALASATAIVNNHAGFDAKGNVIDRAAAAKTLKTFANVLQLHAGSVRNLNEHMNTK
jgi:hypothetical protein